MRLPRILAAVVQNIRKNALLAITMGMRSEGVSLPFEREALTAAMPHAGGKLLVMLHGLCMSDLQWNRKGQDHGTALGRDLAYTTLCGITQPAAPD